MFQRLNMYKNMFWLFNDKSIYIFLHITIFQKLTSIDAWAPESATQSWVKNQAFKPLFLSPNDPPFSTVYGSLVSCISGCSGYLCLTIGTTFKLHKSSISSPHQRKVLNNGRVRGAQKKRLFIYQSLQVTFLGSMAHLFQRLTLMFPQRFSSPEKQNT